MLDDVHLINCRNALLWIQRQRELGRQAPDEGYARTLGALNAALQMSASGPNVDVVEHNWLTAEELADQLGCSTRHVRRTATQRGGIKIGRDWRFPT